MKTEPTSLEVRVECYMNVIEEFSKLAAEKAKAGDEEALLTLMVTADAVLGIHNSELSI